jgi:biotin carboxylase
MRVPHPVLLVAGSGSQSDQEHLLASLAGRHPLWLLDPAAPGWQRPYLAGSTRVDLSDPFALGQAAREVRSARGVLGLVCCDESAALPAAQAAATLGFAGTAVEAVRRCQDRRRMRATLARAGVPQPASIAVSRLEEAMAAATITGYPLVLRRRAAGSGAAAVRVDGPAGLADGFARASADGPTHDAGVLVEEFLDGPEIGVDGFVCDRRYRALFVARTRVGMAPFFEKLEHLVMADDPLLDDEELLATLADAHRALGLDHGMTHAQVRFTSRGPRVVDVHARTGKDLIPYLGWLATGIQPGVVAAQMATGEQPRPEPERRACVGIRFAYPATDCRVRAVGVLEPDPDLGMVTAAALAAPGTELRLPPRGYRSRYAYVICAATHLEACRLRLEAAAARLRLDWRPLPAVEARPDLIERGSTNATREAHLRTSATGAGPAPAPRCADEPPAPACHRAAPAAAGAPVR